MTTEHLTNPSNRTYGEDEPEDRTRSERPSPATLARSLAAQKVTDHSPEGGENDGKGPSQS